MYPGDQRIFCGSSEKGEAVNMQAVILAAGMGKRLKNLTQNNTKCMIRVNGETLIQRMLGQLDELRLSRIVIVIGYEGAKLIDYINTLDIHTPVVYVNNPVYDKTNNIYSLALAKDYLLKEDTLLLESDLIFEPAVLRALLEDPRETLALVDKYESWMDGTVVKLDEEDNITEFVPGKKFVFEDIPFYYKTVNIYKFSKHFSETHYVPFLDAYSKALGNNEYYEQVLRVITLLDDPEIKALKLTGQLWYEIDDIQDLDIASSMFMENSDEQTSMIQHRFGGYWRYPRLTDYCGVNNPYFPTQKLMNEMKANFETLMVRYPSGMRVNSLLASKNFAVDQNHIVVGNGASEIIKCLMEHLNGKIGFIRPTFEEYRKRSGMEEKFIFVPENENFTYTAEDLMRFYQEKDVSAIVMTNPDNPSGNYISKGDMLTFIAWCKKRNIQIVVDETYVDFADEENGTLITEEIIGTYPNLIILKSISQSQGVSGLRLGIMVSADESVIAEMKKSVSIWNINSFAEFYMQIVEKYKKDYQSSLVKLKETRNKMIRGMKEIPGIRLLPTQANFITFEVTDKMTAHELTKKLLREYNIFVRDITKKVNVEGKQFIRIGIRTEEENERLIEILKEIFA